MALRDTELASLRNRYSGDHPDVQRLERIVASLEQRLADAPQRPAPGASRRAPDNPVYLQRQVMLEGTRSELVAAIERRDSLRQRLTGLDDQLAVSPEVEREYRALNRGYEQLVNQYSEVESKLREATTAVNLESQLKGERFVVLSEPGLPTKPSSPNRLAILMLTLVAAAGVGALLVAASERRDDTVRNSRDLKDYLDIPPLVAIPVITTASDKRRSFGRQLAGMTASLAWLIAVAFLIMTPAV
jgi:uncharacterized protein involved in exopolysaccharide biosynthesis